MDKSEPIRVTAGIILGLVFVLMLGLAAFRPMPKWLVINVGLITYALLLPSVPKALDALLSGEDDG